MQQDDTAPRLRLEHENKRQQALCTQVVLDGTLRPGCSSNALHILIVPSAQARAPLHSGVPELCCVATCTTSASCTCAREFERVAASILG